MVQEGTPLQPALSYRMGLSPPLHEPMLRTTWLAGISSGQGGSPRAGLCPDRLRAGCLAEVLLQKQRELESVSFFLHYLLTLPPSCLSIQVLITGQRAEELEQERVAQPQPRCHNSGFLLSQELAGMGVLLGSCMKGSGRALHCRRAMTHSGSVYEEAISGCSHLFLIRLGTCLH